MVFAVRCPLADDLPVFRCSGDGRAFELSFELSFVASRQLVHRTEYSVHRAAENVWRDGDPQPRETYSAPLPPRRSIPRRGGAHSISATMRFGSLGAA